ncbi:hypothetical protein [Microbispora rosea]|uniref:hypothetical protein n=1 Tax=Microbispora rosea TaxID=58117 RepID=UPI00341A3494
MSRAQGQPARRAEALRAAKAVVVEVEEWNKRSHILMTRVLKEQGKLEIVQTELEAAMAELEQLLGTRDSGKLVTLADAASAAISEVLIHVDFRYRDDSAARRGWTEVHLQLKEATRRLSTFLKGLPEQGTGNSGLNSGGKDRLTMRLRGTDDRGIA